MENQQSLLESSIVIYVQSQEKADEKLSEIKPLVQSLYDDSEKYQKDHNKIKPFVRKGMPHHKREVLDKTDILIEKGQLNNPDNKELKRKRENYLAEIVVYFHRIGRASFRTDKYNEHNALKNLPAEKRKRANKSAIESNKE